MVVGCVKTRRADQVLKEALGRFVQLSAPHGVDPAQIAGKRCKLCGEGPATIICTRTHDERARRRYRTVCATCYEPWRGESIMVRKGHVDAQRDPGATEAAHAASVYALELLEGIPAGDLAVSVLKVVYDWPYDEAAEVASGRGEAGQRVFGAEFRGVPGAPWTADAVRRAVKRTREKLERRLEAAELECQGVGVAKETQSDRTSQKRAPVKDYTGGPKMRVSEVSDRLQCSRERVRQMIEEGDIVAVDLRRDGAQQAVYFVYRQSVLDYEKSRRVIPKN